MLDRRSVLEWEACNLIMETVFKYYCSLDIKSVIITLRLMLIYKLNSLTI